MLVFELFVACIALCLQQQALKVKIQEGSTGDASSSHGQQQLTSPTGGLMKLDALLPALL